MTAIVVDTVLDWDLADPVLGLEDVALGRTVSSPQTFYLLRNRDRSGVMGVLFPDGEVLSKRKSSTGQLVEGLDEMGEPFAAVIAWDGAQPSPVSAQPIGYHDKEETQPIFSEHSKGILLGDYPVNGELWRAVAEQRGMR